jgi:hypothetical protein
VHAARGELEPCSYHPLDGISDLRCTVYRATAATDAGRPADAARPTRVEWALTGLALVVAVAGLERG